MFRLSLLALAVSICGCAQDQRYLDAPQGGPFRLLMDTNTPPFFQGEDVSLYLLEQRALVLLKQPTDAQLAELSQGLASLNLPYARKPWAERDDLAYEVDFRLTNFDDTTHRAHVVINGINEFHEYVPGVTEIDDELVVDFAQWERLFSLEPGEIVHRTVREEELDEVAVDLATVVNGAPNPNQVVFFQNQSANDPRVQAFIPAIVPGLVGARVGIRAESEGVAPHIRLDFTIRTRDVTDKLSDNPARFFDYGTPVEFTPTPPMQ